MNFTFPHQWPLQHKAHLILVVLPLWLIGCSSGGGGGGGGRGSEEISVASVEQDIRESFPTGLTISNTLLVADDGYQGTNYDIGRVIISRFNSGDIGFETLGIAMSYMMSGTPPDGTVVAFYIDWDSSTSTGMLINGIGADALFINDFAFAATNSPTYTYSDYYEWSGAGWLPYNGTFTGGATYDGFSINSSFFVSNSSKVPDLIGLTNNQGVMTIQNIPSGDPNDFLNITTLGSSAAFTFAIP